MAQDITKIMIEYPQLNCVKQMKYNDNIDWIKDCKDSSYLRILYYPCASKLEMIKMKLHHLFYVFKIILKIYQIYARLFYKITGIKFKKDPIMSLNNKKTSYLSHCDLGLITFGCHATNNGLQINIPKTDKWINVYDILNDNDIIIYSGYTMSLISCGYYKPLLHKVDMNLNNFKHKHRLSMPFFYRFNDNVTIPLFKQEYFQNSLYNIPSNNNSHSINISSNKNISDKSIYINKTISIGELIGNLQKQRFLREIKYVH